MSDIADVLNRLNELGRDDLSEAVHCLMGERDNLAFRLSEAEAGELKNALAVGQAVLELSEERKENATLRAQLSEAQARLAELEVPTVRFPRQPNGDGGWTIDMHYVTAIMKDCPVEWRPCEEEVEAVLLAVERATPVPQAAQAAQCAWQEDEDGVYDTSCGNRWEFTEGGVADNDVKFCPYCGGTVDEHQYNDMPEGE